MKRLAITGAVAALLLAFGLAGQAAEKQGGAKATGGKATLMPAEALKWIDPPNSPPGVKMAVLWGDPGKGAHGAFHKLPAGFVAPMHHHSANHHVVVVSGTMIETVDGKETKLGPGSYFAYTGKKMHVTKCLEGSECVLMVDCAGPWDIEMAEAPKK